MRADRLASVLEKQIPPGFVISSYPDHPHLFAGPDLLIGGEGKLCALFLAKQREIWATDNLLARLTASRLAMPEHMRCAVVVDHTNANFEESVKREFLEIFGPDQAREIARFVKLSNTAAGFQIVPAEIRAHAMLRYQILFQITRLRLSHPRGARPYDLLHSLRMEGGTRPKAIALPQSVEKDRHGWYRNIVEEENFAVGATSFAPGISAQKRIQPFCVYSIRRSYVLDNGVPYLRDSDPNILVIDEQPTGMLDPLKPVRCANFAGWALAAADSPQDVAALADRIRESFDKQRR
jgi:hypothetical protein